MEIMGFISVVFALFLLSNCNIKPSNSRKNGHLDTKNFISIATSTINQRACTCIMPNSCSCCEIVKIYYTGNEQTLCFNMVYQINGLNFDLSMDSTIIKSMIVANYRPFRMCASVPGLLLSSICVNVLDIHQLPSSIVVCPRLEVSNKIQRWNINYTCQNVSSQTMSATTVTPLMATNQPMQLVIMPGMMSVMAPTSGIMAMRPATVMTGQQSMQQNPSPAIMMIRPMMSTGAVAPNASPPKSSPPNVAMPAQQMMPIAGMMVMGMRPATSSTSAVMMPAATATATPSTTATAQRPPTTMTKPAGVQQPSAVPTPTGAMLSMMPPTGVIVPRPADGLAHSVEMLSRNLADDSSSIYEDGLVETDKIDSMHGPVRVQQNGTIDSEINEQEIAFTTQQVHEETTDDQVSTIENTTELIQQSDSSRILNRKKRQYDIFDIFHQSNRCDRAYRICITKSNNYIVSKLRGTRFNGNKNKDMDCTNRPTKIVHAPGHNLCSTSTMSNDFASASLTQDSNNSNSQSDDTLDAIVVSDDSDDDSAFYAQNYPQIASITPYSRPRVFPMRTPPLVVSQLKEHLEKFTNDSLFISRM